MPEPTTAPILMVAINEARADLDYHGQLITAPDATYNPDALAVVSAATTFRDAYDSAAAAIEVYRSDIASLRARAAAAEAAVQRVREAAKVGHDQCVYRPHAIEDEYERGKAHALDDVYRLLAGAADTPPQSDLTTVSGIVNAAPDDQPVTVTGYIHHVDARANRAGAAYVELVLVDRNAEIEDSDPAAVKVVIPAPVYAGWDLALSPQEGTLVEITGRTVREVVVIASGVQELTCPGHLGSDPEDPQYCDGTCRFVGSQP
jgi:hypothetical protein